MRILLQHHRKSQDGVNPEVNPSPWRDYGELTSCSNLCVTKMRRIRSVRIEMMNRWEEGVRRLPSDKHLYRSDGSSQLSERFPNAMKPALARHGVMLRAGVEAMDGHVRPWTGT